MNEDLGTEAFDKAKADKTSYSRFQKARKLNLPTVYVASKIELAPLWKEFRKKYETGLVVSSSWIDMIEKVRPSPKNALGFWALDIEEVEKSDFLILFGQEGKSLRGGLVEAGAAIASGKFVILIGDHPDYGTWQYHPLVAKVSDLDSAAEEIMKGWDSF